MDDPAPPRDPRMYEEIRARALEFASREVSHGRALEVAHDVAVDLLRRPGAEIPPAPLVYVAVMRKLRDASRTVNRRAVREGAYLEDRSGQMPAWALPGADLEARELADRVARVVANMPAAMREVFILVRDQQMSYKDAAARLGVGVGTVHTQLSRAAVLLRECVERYHADAPAVVHSKHQRKS